MRLISIISRNISFVRIYLLHKKSNSRGDAYSQWAAVSAQYELSMAKPQPPHRLDIQLGCPVISLNLPINGHCSIELICFPPNIFCIGFEFFGNKNACKITSLASNFISKK